jgi:hypothetical protein
VTRDIKKGNERRVSAALECSLTVKKPDAPAAIRIIEG